MIKVTLDKEAVVSGNKTIANFMGYFYIPFNNELAHSAGWWHKDTPKKLLQGGIGMKINNYFLCRRHHELRYYNSWDWLVPVVDKIYKDHRELIGSNLYFNTTYDAMGQALATRNKERLFQVILRFLNKAND